MPKYKNPRRTWQYSQEFKATAVEMSLLDGVRNKDVAEKLDIHPYMLSRWRKEVNEGKIVVDKRKKQKNIAELKKELKETQLERDILKKAGGIFSKSDKTSIHSLN